jgi:molybdate transport system substrate-binding protein
MRKPLPILLLAAMALAACLPLRAEAPGLSVFAAASLSESLQDIAALWARAGHGKLSFNFHASGSLARQILEGAPADVFVGADEASMDQLQSAGLLEPGSRVSLLSNTLVVVARADSAVKVSAAADLAGLGRLAIGDPAAVPAGAYAKAWLSKLGLWGKLIDKAVPCDNVRAVLAAVESGNVDAGIVYGTDALISKKIRVALEVPAAEGPKISYPLAVLKGAAEKEEALKFAGFLQGPEAAKAFKARGFLLLKPAD